MLLPAMVFDIHMVGPNISSLVDGQVLTLRPSLTVTLHHGLYHDVHTQLPAPNIVVGEYFTSGASSQRLQFVDFSEQGVNVWNSLADSVDFS